MTALKYLKHVFGGLFLMVLSIIIGMVALESLFWGWGFWGLIVMCVLGIVALAVFVLAVYFIKKSKRHV